jgi:potassium efflux system protein
MVARVGFLRLLLLLLLVAPLWAQTGTPDPAATPQAVRTLAELQARLAEVETNLRAVPLEAVSETEEAGGPPSYYTSLLRIETSLRRMISMQETEALLQSQIERVDAEGATLTQHGLEQARPYPITLLDQLQYDLDLAEQELSSEQVGLTTARAEARLRSRQLDEQQALRRRLLDQAARDKSASALETERAIENATWAVKANETLLELANAEVRLSEKSLSLAQKKRDLLSRKVALVKEHFQFTKDMLDRRIVELDSERAELSAQHEAVQREGAAMLEKVRALANAQQPDQVAEREARTEWLTTYQRRKLLLEQALEMNLIKRELWERRYQLSHGMALNTLSDWSDATAGVVRLLQSYQEGLNEQLAQLRGRLASVVESSAYDGSAAARWGGEASRALADRQNALETALRETNKTYALAQRLSSELQQTRKGLSGKERLARVWSSVGEVWGTELYSIGDATVTVGKVVVAFLVLLIGLGAAGRITTFISRRLLAQLPLTDTALANISRGFRALYLLLVFLFALRVVNIPLTIFTFLGGTLAIAVGFGAQNVFNNFISGLILMVERPVRVGDLIEVDGTTGTVEEIGARSTRVKLGTGVHVVLPNSTLLQNKVVNWTLTDQMVRSSVTVGVAYGSDPVQVMELLSRATLSIDTIEKTPEHLVVLEELGDDALKFTISFTVSLQKPLNKRLSESNLRLAILKLLEENGIAIPYPQRDINFNKPVPVRLLEGPKETSQL